MLYFIAFTVILLFFTYSFLYLLSAVKHFGTLKWIVVKGCINKLHIHIHIHIYQRGDTTDSHLSFFLFLRITKNAGQEVIVKYGRPIPGGLHQAEQSAGL